MQLPLARIKALLLEALSHLRRPTKRGVAMALAAIPALLLIYTLILIPFTPSISDIRKAKVEQPAIVLSADGKQLAEFKWANREWVALADIAPNVVNALIATEDHRFYSHHGIDLRRTMGAALKTFSGDRQGGSTITQQLARNLYPEEIGRAASLTRKLKEAITALKIEAIYTKDEILETYLNTVPFLYNAYGIEMAARTYFGKSSKELDVLESATLIGMLKGNSYYNPVLNPERAVSRRNTVLGQMVKREKLDPTRFETLKKRPLRIDFERQTEPVGPAPHFARQLRKWLITWADRHDYNIYADGLVVRTTIDSRLQSFANRIVARQGDRLQDIADQAWRSGWNANPDLVRAFIRETSEFQTTRAGGLGEDEVIEKLRKDSAFMRALREDKTRLQAGFLAIDPRNGQIRAWVGSRDFNLDPFDHVQQARRQPGSTFKPFVYGAAFEKGMSPDDTLTDQAVEIQLAGGEIWRPSDGGEPSGRLMSLRDALAYSKNTITAQVMQEVGAGRVVRLARAMGVRQSRLEAVPSLALGTSPVTLREMVSAYSTIANLGKYIEPTMVTRIEDRDGNVLQEFQAPSAEGAMSEDAAKTLVDAMRGVVERGTGSAIRRQFGIRGDVAGKTGTTQDNTDGWFILMHPQLVAGAWVGFNDARVTLRSDYWGQGAHNALPMVGDFFLQSLRSRLIDSRVKFYEPEEQGFFGRWFGALKEWVSGLFASEPEQKAAGKSKAKVEASRPVTPPPAPPVISAPPPVPEVSGPLPTASVPLAPIPSAPVVPPPFPSASEGAAGVPTPSQSAGM